MPTPQASSYPLRFPFGTIFTPRGSIVSVYAAPPIILWCVLLACAAAALCFPGGAAWGAAAILGLVSAWLCQECARRVVKSENPDVGTTGVPVRNRLTLWLGSALGIPLGAAIARGAVGSISQSVSQIYVQVNASTVTFNSAELALAFAERHAAELASPDDKGTVEQAALRQVG